MADRDYNHDGLSAAAKVFASAMRKIAAVKTRRTADAVNISWQGSTVHIRGGHPGGVYGWEPVTAFMFDDNARHPLFGSKRHWYAQGHYPITQMTVDQSADDAADAYAEAAIDPMLRDHGFS